MVGGGDLFDVVASMGEVLRNKILLQYFGLLITLLLLLSSVSSGKELRTVGL